MRMVIVNKSQKQRWLTARQITDRSYVECLRRDRGIRDEQDIRSLAVEIATLTRRQQRGKGLRMA